MVAPWLSPDGTFALRTEGRKIRIYESIDTRMMFNQFLKWMLNRFVSTRLIVRGLGGLLYGSMPG